MACDVLCRLRGRVALSLRGAGGVLQGRGRGLGGTAARGGQHVPQALVSQLSLEYSMRGCPASAFSSPCTAAAWPSIQRQRSTAGPQPARHAAAPAVIQHLLPPSTLWEHQTRQLHLAVQRMHCSAGDGASLAPDSSSKEGVGTLRRRVRIVGRGCLQRSCAMGLCSKVDFACLCYAVHMHHVP